MPSSKGELLVYQPGASRVSVSIELDKPPTLEELRGHLNNGWLEIVPGFTSIERNGQVVRCIAYCDEDGKLKPLEPNSLATMLWDAALPGGIRYPDGSYADVLFGPVVIVIGDARMRGESGDGP